MSDRLPKVNKLLQHILSDAFIARLEFPVGALVTIVKVIVSKDLRHAKVFLTVFPLQASGQVLRVAAAAQPELQSILYYKLQFRPVPKLRFVLDTTEAKAEAIEDLLDRIKKPG